VSRLAAPKFHADGSFVIYRADTNQLITRHFVTHHFFGSLVTVFAHKTEKFIFRCSLVPFGALWCRFAGEAWWQPTISALVAPVRSAHHSSLCHSSLFLPLATMFLGGTPKTAAGPAALPLEI
jgi:hypothetical protein